MRIRVTLTLKSRALTALRNYIEEWYIDQPMEIIVEDLCRTHQILTDMYEKDEIFDVHTKYCPEMVFKSNWFVVK